MFQLLPHLLLRSRRQSKLEDDSGYLTSSVLCVPTQAPKYSGIALRMGLENRCGGYTKISHVAYEESHMTSVNILGFLQVSDEARLRGCSQPAQGAARVSPGSCGSAVHAG